MEGGGSSRGNASFYVPLLSTLRENAEGDDGAVQSPSPPPPPEEGTTEDQAKAQAEEEEAVEAAGNAAEKHKNFFLLLLYGVSTAMQVQVPGIEPGRGVGAGGLTSKHTSCSQRVANGNPKRISFFGRVKGIWLELAAWRDASVFRQRYRAGVLLFVSHVVMA